MYENNILKDLINNKFSLLYVNDIYIYILFLCYFFAFDKKYILAKEGWESKRKFTCTKLIKKNWKKTTWKDKYILRFDI
jgi:hypothetical protein